MESEKTELETAVINCFDKHKRNYGRIRIKKSLKREGIVISEQKISRILAENNRIAKLGRKCKSKPKKHEIEYINENLVLHNLLGHEVNKLWCSDIHEMKCKSGKFYACGIIDAGSRRIIGWEIERHQRQDIVQNAILMAVGRSGKKKEDIIFHSDRGCQYTAKKTNMLLIENGFKLSMSRPGTPNDNQLIETFWKTMDLEIQSIRELDFSSAFRKVVEYIELYYNSERLHSAIDYQTPNEFYFSLFDVS